VEYGATERATECPFEVGAESWTVFVGIAYGCFSSPA
jgi:hypothetical protein